MSVCVLGLMQNIYDGEMMGPRLIAKSLNDLGLRTIAFRGTTKFLWVYRICRFYWAKNLTHLEYCAYGNCLHINTCSTICEIDENVAVTLN